MTPLSARFLPFLLVASTFSWSVNSANAATTAARPPIQPTQSENAFAKAHMGACSLKEAQDAPAFADSALNAGKLTLPAQDFPQPGFHPSPLVVESAAKRNPKSEASPSSVLRAPVMDLSAPAPGAPSAQCRQ